MVFTNIYTSAFAQEITLKGQITDYDKNPIPFATLFIENTQLASICDIDGNFEITFQKEFENKKLLINCVGYEKKAVPLNVLKANENNKIKLKSTDVIIDEVVVKAGENPAHRIINQCIKNKDNNDPEQMSSFSYTSYNKMFVTNEINSNNDSLLSLDTSKLTKTQKFFTKQHLFLTESATERFFKSPNKNFEKVLASRVSGFKLSPFSLLATQMQSFSFYPDQIDLLGIKYLNPISKGSTSRYFFLLQDTIFQGKDTVFVISFQPKINKNYNALKGTLYINTNTFGLQNVIAEPSIQDKTVSISIQQKYDFIDNNHWFPSELNADWYYQTINVSDTTFTVGSKPKSANSRIKAVSRTYIKNVKLNPTIDKKLFSEVELSIDKNSNNKEEEFWNQFRVDSLTSKDKKTYTVIDSVGKAENLDKKLFWIETFASGKLPIGYFDLDIDKLLAYNNYEGYRLSLGLHTNQKLSKYFIIGGYGAYGFKDKAFKYGTDMQVYLWKKPELTWSTSYQKDLIESGGVQFNEVRQNISTTETYRNFLVGKKDKLELIQTGIGFRMFKYFKIFTYLNSEKRGNFIGFGISENNYTSVKDTINSNQIGCSIRFIYKEKFIQTPRNKISLGSNYPTINLNISKSISNTIFNRTSDLSFTKIDVKIDKIFYFKHIGKQSIQINAGQVFGKVPYTYLYNNKGSWLKGFNISARNTFETMGLNEFVSSKYASIFINHNIGRFLKLRKKFNPELELVHNMGIGKLDNVDVIFNNSIKMLNKGYFESGLRINTIIKSGITGIGVGGFYRYGSYAYNNIKRDLTVKMTLVIAF